MELPRILIVGGGFAGIFCAKKLDKLFGKEAKITLVSNKPHFEYHAALYRVVNEGTPLQACVPLREIFKDTNVEVIIDTVHSIDTGKNTAYNELKERYHYDHLVLGLGSENSYFGIPGISKYSYSMRTIPEALKLAHHIHDTLDDHKNEQNEQLMEIAVIGGGPAGVELAGELAVHTQEVVAKHRLHKSAVQIELIEAMDRILPMLTPTESKHIQERLEALGVKVSTKTKVEEGIETGLKTDTGLIKTKTVIWTAGAKANFLFTDWGFVVGKGGKVEVNEYLQAQIPEPPVPGAQALEGTVQDEPKKNYLYNVYIAGDGANVPSSGQALPARTMGEIAADNIYNKINNLPLKKYNAPIPLLIIPVGHRWAYAKVSAWVFSGLFGAFVYKLWNLYFFSILLSPSKAFSVLRREHQTCDICETCMHNYQQKLY
ncbi:MAG: FAD-dependent oxidoreductase [bacterium]|nr:FAD-dependent oxidoreductase [bacterium]